MLAILFSPLYYIGMRFPFTKSFFTLYLIWSSLGIAALFAIVTQNWLNLFIALSTLLLTALPFLLQNRYRFFIPVGFTAAIAFFIFSAIFLGEVHNFYETFWWWDTILHTVSAFGFGLIGVVVLLLLYRGERIEAHPKILAVFVFFFALAIGALWEIFEFSMDQAFGFHMQKNGLHDTMWDLIVDAIGGGIAAVAGYFYITRGWKKGVVSGLITEWVEKNITH